MSQVSKRKLDPQIVKKIEKLFVQALVSCDSGKKAQDLIFDLLTPTERIMLAKRIAIAFYLSEGVSYRRISDLLKVSTATIGRVSEWKNESGGGFKSILGQLDSKNSLLEEAIKSVLLLALLPGKGRNNKKLTQLRRSLS